MSDETNAEPQAAQEQPAEQERLSELQAARQGGSGPAPKPGDKTTLPSDKLTKQAAALARYLPGFALIEKTFPVLYWLLLNPLFFFIPPLFRLILFFLIPGPWLLPAWIGGFIGHGIFRKIPKATAFELAASGVHALLILLLLGMVGFTILCTSLSGQAARVALNFLTDTNITCGF